MRLRGLTVAVGVLVPGLMAAFPAAPVSAQAALGTDCELRQDYRIFSTRQVSPGNRITYVGGPYLTCPDGLRIEADSAVVYEASGRTELLGEVRFRHPERELDASLADYYEREGRLFARGDVRFRDVLGGTEVEGDTLDFRESTSTRPEQQLTVWGERSVAWLVPSGEAASVESGDPEDGTPDRYRVAADRLRFEGEDFFWGDGNVEVERDDLRATSDSLAFDQPGGQLILTGGADVIRDGVRATGGIVNLAIRDDVLESLRTRREGRIETEDGTILTGEDVLVRLGPDEQIETVNAEGTDEVLATLQAEAVLFVGRTIEISEGENDTRTIRATGRARGETETDAPPLRLGGEGDVGDGLLIERDWIEGNEITADFRRLDPGDPSDAPAPDVAEVDSLETGDVLDDSGSNPQYELERLESTGNARTLYRQLDEQDDDEEAAASDEPEDDAGEPEVRSDRWSISYIQADRIVIHLLDGEVERVEAEGSTVDGIQLDPVSEGDDSGEAGTDTGGAGR